eukprot:g12133.t1
MTSNADNPNLLQPEEHVLSTLEHDGSRRWLYPKLSKGSYLFWRRVVAWVLIGIFTAIPFIKINGQPAILLDIIRREFHIFGITFLPTDTILLALLLLTCFLSIFFVTALFGRVWCGWGCPQTVYMEFVFRPIERFFDGRAGLGGKPAKPPAAWRSVAKYLVFYALCLHLTHVFLAYFVGVEQLFQWSLGSPLNHPLAFAFIFFVSAALMFHASVFREQLCIVACPYGRMQSVLLDNSSMIISYDEKRGESRGKLGKAKRQAFEQKNLPETERTVGLDILQLHGDCIDCGECVTTCPTGINIREGLQLECVGCAQCIDACDAIMDRVGRPKGLIRYTSQQALDGKSGRILRPRLGVYAALVTVVFSTFLFALVNRSMADVTPMRERGRPFVVMDGGVILNQAQLRIVNRDRVTHAYSVQVAEPAGVSVVVDEGLQSLEPGGAQTVSVDLMAPFELFSTGRLDVQLVVRDSRQVVSEDTFQMKGPFKLDGPSEQDEALRRFIMPSVVLGLLGAHMVFIFTAITLGTGDPSFAVVPDYYEKAVDYDEHKALLAQSAQLGWSVELVPSTHADVAGQRELMLRLRDAGDQPVEGAEVRVTGYHLARAGEPVEMTCVQTLPGVYVGQASIGKEVCPAGGGLAMIALVTAVFLASLLGSLHCAGMCGAFVAFAVSDTEGRPGQRIALSSAYHGGRFLTYVALGVAAGSAGALLDLSGALVGVSRVAMSLAGAVMVLFGLSSAMAAMGKRSIRLPVPGFMHKLLSVGHKAAMQLSPVRRALTIGLLTTLLPCGWLYAFAAVAGGTASPLLGGLTMAVFWLGTLPVLVSLGVGVQRFSGALGRRLPHATAVALILVGLWTLIGRGGLDAASLAAEQPVVHDAASATAAGLVVDGREQQFCCQGCASVYEVIHGCGLDTYYRLRDNSDAAGQAVQPTDRDRLAAFDTDKFHELYVRTRDDGACVVDLMLEGVHCAACVWLIEKLARVVPGVIEARLSMRQATVRITWDPAIVELSAVARGLSTLGYPPHPARGNKDGVQLAEQRTMLIRIGVAGALAGNTMLLAFALYTGLFSAMEEQFAELFRWASAVLGGIALAWPGRVFFQGALAALRTRSPHLDVPIALALGVGGLAGLVNVVLGRGEIYFDSLTVLVFLLLVGRFIQYRQQRRADESVGLLFSLTPTHCRRVLQGSSIEQVEQVPVEAVQVGDLLEVRSGELIPADGTVEQGRASVIASLLTGESKPVSVQPGDGVCAGSQLASATIRLRVAAVGEQTRVGKLMGLVQQGVAEKPEIVALTDRIAGWFVVVVSTIALAVFAVWSTIDLSAAVDHTVALLIIACPCALGLATPLTLAVAIGRSARNDILIKSGAVLDRLAKPGRLLMDKTGTMTRGAMRVEDWVGDASIQQLVIEAERHATHPIAQAIVRFGGDEQHGRAKATAVTDVRVDDCGIMTETAQGPLHIGSIRYMERHACVVESAHREQAAAWAEQALTTVYIAFSGRVVSQLAVGDALHNDTRVSIAQLKQWGWEIEMLTGDEAGVAKQVGQAVGLPHDAIHAGVGPEQKLAEIKQRDDGRAVVMVGDGVNDAAGLAAADVGIAVSGGAEPSLAAADVYLAQPGLGGLVRLIATARRSRSVVYQNLALSLAYNAVAIVLAAMGLLTPLLAAVLMPLSSATAMCRLAAIRSQGYASMHDICEGTDLPDQFIAKIMRSLTKAELLTSARGRGGGFALARDPGSISLYDIVEVIDGVQQYTGCVLGLSACDDKQPCPQHEYVKPVRRQVIQYLKNTTLDVMSKALVEKQQLIQLVSLPVAADDPSEDLATFNPLLTGVADQCRDATVGIVIPGGSMGSGVIISEDGLILTAAHVLPEAGGDVVIVLSDGRQVAGKALGVNRGVDSGMAQIVVDGKYPHAPVADSDTMWEGDWCIAFGHGGGVQTDRPAPMRLGRMLHVNSDTNSIRWLTTDCTVISGDSGGPLFDLQGNVIGIHSNIGMSVLVNRHVPISAYHAQWDELLEAGKEISNPPPPKAALLPGLDTLPGTIEREIARQLNNNDEALKQELEGLRDEDGRIEMTPEKAAALFGRDDLIQELRAFQKRIAERQRRTDEIAKAGDAKADTPPSGVSRQIELTRLMLIEKKRERMLDGIAEDLRKTHGKIAPHVLARFEPVVSSAGRNTVEVVCRGTVVALGTVVREDGYIVTKASELNGPVHVRLNDRKYMARIVNGNGPNDLALLKIDANDLTPIRWTSETPVLGSLLVVPGADQQPMAMAVLSVGARVIPRRVNNVRIEPPSKPFLGISDLQADVEKGGVHVGSVQEGGAAAKAGLQKGDRITMINGEAIDSVAKLIEWVQNAKIGDNATMTIERGEETLELTATLGKRPATPEPAAGDDRQSAAQVYSARAGKLSERRTDFPLALTHDAVIWAPQIGGPVLNAEGQAVGINIARYGRTATYAIPADHAKQAIDQMMGGPLRYRFRGLMRDSGKPVEGHVDAPDGETAFKLMADNGIVCESLREDPVARPLAAPEGGSAQDAEVASQIESALDVSSTDVNVDDLWKRYRGQRVRVIDRDKIRSNVLSVMTKALQQSGGGNNNQTLERVEEALTKMFGDNKNLTSELSPTQTALEDQITRLNGVVLRLEKQLAQLTMAIRRGGYGGGGGAPSGRLMKQVRDPKNDKVLLEIFETNLDLQRQIKKKEQADINRSSVSSATGIRKTLESYVGWPKDAVSSKKFDGRDIIYGKEAIDNRLSLDLYRPLAAGVIKDGGDQGDRNLEAARELIARLVEMTEPGRGESLYGVIGVPSEASITNKQAILDVAKGTLDSVMIVTEPFCVAYGMDRISDVLVVDIGAGTTDLCRMHGTVPSEEDQITIDIAGDNVDAKMLELINKAYPNASVNMTMVKKIKEKFGFVHTAKDKIEVEFPVDGKPTKHDVTDIVREACTILVDPIVDAIHKLVATFDPEFQQQLRENIILSGGGGLMDGLNKAIEDKLEIVGGASVTVVEEPLYAGSNGALQLALDMPADYWQQLK